MGELGIEEPVRTVAFRRRINADIPFSGGLETPRLRLRRLTVRDAEAIQSLVSNWEVAKQTRFFPHPYSMAHAVEFIQGAEEDWANRREFVLAIEHLDEKELIGAISVTISRPWFRRVGEVGYWLGEDYWGQGLAGEAVAAFLGFCHHNLALTRLSARVFVENEASLRLLSAQGFEQVKQLTEHLPERGGKRKILCLRRNVT